MPSTPRPYELLEANYRQLLDYRPNVAILPWGATEAHNYHLPFGTDNFEADYVAAEAAGKAWEKGAKVVVLPAIPFGVNTGQLDVKLCINMNPSTQYLVLKDLIDVLSRQNLDKLVIMNAHGGNNFKQMIRELSTVYPNVFVCAVDWSKIVDSSKYFHERGDHAGELETSAMMHIAPDLVLPLSEAGDGYARGFKLKGLREGWVSAQRDWTKVTKDTGVGNPSQASKEKGRKFLQDSIKEISEFLIELARADVNDLYE